MRGSSFLLLMAILAFNLTACKKECGSVCSNGTEIKCKCECKDGYEGTDCSKRIIDKFIGRFFGTESCSFTGTGAYTVEVTGDDFNIKRAYFSNLWNANEITIGNLATDGNIYLYHQAMGQRDSIIGKAVLFNGQLKISYIISNNPFISAQHDNCIWQQQ